MWGPCPLQRPAPMDLTRIPPSQTSAAYAGHDLPRGRRDLRVDPLQVVLSHPVGETLVHLQRELPQLFPRLRRQLMDLYPRRLDALGGVRVAIPHRRPLPPAGLLHGLHQDRLIRLGLRIEPWL